MRINLRWQGHNPTFTKTTYKGATLTWRSEAGELAGASHQNRLNTEGIPKPSESVREPAPANLAGNRLRVRVAPLKLPSQALSTVKRPRVGHDIGCVLTRVVPISERDEPNSEMVVLTGKPYRAYPWHPQSIIVAREGHIESSPQ